MTSLILIAMQALLSIFVVTIAVATYRLSCAYRDLGREERRVERLIERRADGAKLKVERRRAALAARRRVTPATRGVIAARKTQQAGQRGSKQA